MQSGPQAWRKFTAHGIAQDPARTRKECNGSLDDINQEKPRPEGGTQKGTSRIILADHLGYSPFRRSPPPECGRRLLARSPQVARYRGQERGRKEWWRDGARRRGPAVCKTAVRRTGEKNWGRWFRGGSPPLFLG